MWAQRTGKPSQNIIIRMVPLRLERNTVDTNSTGLPIESKKDDYLLIHNGPQSCAARFVYACMPPIAILDAALYLRNRRLLVYL